ncbi:MAG TPA: OmpA family protein [Rhizomicrobium sp.]|nr:OmpA family protein [Rhizomicrobium sp.]
MRLRYSGGALLALLALGTAARAQIYDNSEVVVNPAYGGGSRVLLYPDNKHVRVQRQLLQPGQVDPNAPIHLHMPYPHKAFRHVAKAKPKTTVAASKAPPQPQQTADQSAPQDMLSFGPVPGESAASLVTPTPPAKKVVAAPPKAPAPKKVAVAPPPRPAPKKTAAAPPPVDNSAMSFMPSTIVSAPPAAKPARTASIEPADTKNMSKRSSIPFAPAAEEPAPEVLDTIKSISGDLNTALNNGSARIELEAFGGKPNDKSSEARRLSLKRALIVRQLLIDEGVPSERIDVRAMGGASSGSADRVDIFVRA